MSYETIKPFIVHFSLTVAKEHFVSFLSVETQFSSVQFSDF